MSRSSLRALLCGCGVGLSCWWAPAQANAQANYDGVLLGGRTAMMGGAAVAKGSDGATAFLNPAGLIRIPGESFSFSTFAVQASARSVDQHGDPLSVLDLGNTDGVEFNTRILPNTFCLFLDGPPKDDYSGRSRHKYGVCVADTEKEQFFFSSNLKGRLSGDVRAAQSHTTQMSFERSSAAFAWGFELERGTNIGVTARVDNSRFRDQTTATVFAEIGGQADMQTMTHSRVSASWDSSVTVGLTHDVSRVVTLGASLSTPSLHLLGFHLGSSVMAPGGDERKALVQDEGDFRYNQPATLRLGLAFSWPMLNFEVNGNFYGAQEVLARAKFDRVSTITEGGDLISQITERGAITERSKPVVNLAAGVEAFLESDFSIVAGVQTDFSGLERRQNALGADTLFRQRKDAIHASIGVASYGSAGSLLLGLRGYYAVGEILVADPIQSTPSFSALPQTDWGLSFVVSGQISFESVRDTAVRAASPLTGTEEEEEGEERP